MAQPSVVGGAGAGVGGIVASTQGEGPPLDNYDPVLTGTVSIEHATTPEANTVFTGTPTLDQNTTTANFLYSQGFSTGTLMTVAFNNSRVASNSAFNTLNPTLTPNFRFELRQHLLSGFGFDPNLRWIRIARNNREIEDVTFRLQVIQTVSQIENIYWDLVNAYSSVTVQQRALDLSQQDAFRQSEASGRGHAGSADRGAVAECRGYGRAKPDRRAGESAVATTAHEERNHP